MAGATGTRIVTPSWRPDGQAILAAVAVGDGPFNIYEFSTTASPGDAHQLTHVSGGATWPEVSPDGRTLVYVGYSSDGFDLYSLPYPDEARAVAIGPGETSQSIGASAPDVDDRCDIRPSRRWRPRRGPRSSNGTATRSAWVRRHLVWTCSAITPGRRPRRGSRPRRTVRRRPTAPHPTGSCLTPTIAGVQRSFWRPRPRRRSSRDPPHRRARRLTATDRELLLEAGVVVPLVRVRHQHQAFASLFRARDEYALVDERRTSVDRASLRAAWRTNTARTYGYSISPEAGVTAGATVELVRQFLGADGDATITTGDARAYVAGFRAHDVIAVRGRGRDFERRSPCRPDVSARRLGTRRQRSGFRQRRDESVARLPR